MNPFYLALKELSIAPVRFVPWVLCAGGLFLGVRLFQAKEVILSQLHLSQPLFTVALAKEETVQNPGMEGGMTTPAIATASPTTVSQSSTGPMDLLNLTPQDVQVLESLDQRRRQIESRVSALDKKEAYLEAVEARVDQKISDLENIYAALKNVVENREKWEDQQLKGLVKIYEIMKPQEAAKILSGVELDVLLSVMERMKEQKASAILAAMDPFVSQRITVELAERLRVTGQLDQKLSP